MLKDLSTFDTAVLVAFISLISATLGTVLNNAFQHYTKKRAAEDESTKVVLRAGASHSENFIELSNQVVTLTQAFQALNTTLGDVQAKNRALETEIHKLRIENEDLRMSIATIKKDRDIHKEHTEYYKRRLDEFIDRYNVEISEILST